MPGLMRADNGMNIFVRKECWTCSAWSGRRTAATRRGCTGSARRGLAAFGALVGRAGWVVARANSNPLYHVVTLKKVGSLHAVGASDPCRARGRDEDDGRRRSVRSAHRLFASAGRERRGPQADEASPGLAPKEYAEKHPEVIAEIRREADARRATVTPVENRPEEYAGNRLSGSEVPRVRNVRRTRREPE